ncbi:MAG: MurR/RpiR family transcriptional regulator [Ignavibacteriota bacterium]|jgi:DNA-binding MurR/RpiR family transcriptional regulator|nr:MAG: MurR/RpiR family transcriptional regulator [Ignavibacterium sp.]MBL1153751.1 MurR/RpiR family transcriptional regulator [Ignavibacteriota bacterium]MCO6447023.1 MurR/RpiR family transcriptional regulator [Ignavibacterium album]MCZ2267901.1 MurR/RpiR family transcriptional regulator [Ignavibacteriales bacterium]MDX9713605.1 MurR/RpiR family transcriptional regulator [Ignavibacteriaceae bacterium]
MDRYKEIKEQIISKYNSFPQNHRKIADYFINNFDKIPFLNVLDLSKAAGTSVASIVRFSQRAGFKGFNELRDEITGSLRKELSNKQIFPLIEKHKIKKDLLTEVANLDIKNINNTLNLIERKTFDFVIDRILKSERVFTAGLGISYLLAEILAYQLTQVGVSSSILNHTHTVFNENILFLNSNDLLMVFSFPPYSKETIEAAKFAQERKIDVIAVTNQPAAPVTFFSKANLLVKSENMLFTNSFAAISVLINALATACAIKDRQRAKRILKESQEIMIHQDQVIIESKQ